MLRITAKRSDDTNDLRSSSYKKRGPTIARMDLDERAHKVSKTWKMVSHYGRSNIGIDLTHKAYKDLKMETMQGLWDAVRRNLLPDGASDLRIDLSNLTVRFKDKSGNLQYIDMASRHFEEPEIIELIQKVRSMAKNVWKTAYASDSLNRSKKGPKPLEIISEKWKRAMPQNLEQFEKTGGKKLLLDHLASRELDTYSANNRIQHMDHYIQGYQENIQRKIREKKERMSDPRTPPNERVNLQKHLSKMEELYNRFNEIDRFAIYWAVGISGEENPDDLTPKQRIENANRVTEGVQIALTQRLKPGVDERWHITRFLGLKERSAIDVSRMRPFVAAYAFDAGDLVLHDKLESIRRVDEQGMVAKGPTMEEYLVYSFLRKDALSPDQAKNALIALGYSEGISEELASISLESL